MFMGRNVISVFESSALVNCCVVIQVTTSLVFDCLALVNCCVVVCFELSVLQSVVFVFITNIYKSQLYKAQEKKLGKQIQSV